MRVLVVGSGAREHALVWKLALSPRVGQIYCAPGNAGTGVIARNVPIPVGNIQGLADWAIENRIDLTIVGPERPLIEGIVDAFRRAGLRIFGPTAAAATIEGSKVWTKKLLSKYGIPTARAETITDYSQAEAALDRCTFPLAVKADGDAAGKGVVIARNREEAARAIKEFMVDHTVGAAGDRVLLEEFLEGVELSVLALTDGRTIVPMAPSCDYKRALDGDGGPNTGGMGAYSPPRFATPELMETIQRTILEPTVAAMAAEGRTYSGVLYAGLMITGDGPKVLEYNCRLGDPETQVVLPLLKTDLAEVAMAVVEGGLDRLKIEWDSASCCGVVMASQGYPGSYPTGLPIDGLDAVEEGVLVFHAGTKTGPDPRQADPLARLKKELLVAAPSGNAVLTAGGRVLTVVACGPTMADAREMVYRNVERIHFQGCHFRRDIALRELPALSHEQSATIE
ncbi:MAG: phosphoribosylamine--glycine ligase [Sphingomonadaceae bacterium]